MPSCGRDVVGDLLRVAGDHHDAHAMACSCATACARLGPDLVLERDRTDDRVVPRDVQHRRAARCPRSDRRRRARPAARGRVRAAGRARRPRPDGRRRSLRHRGRSATGTRARPGALPLVRAAATMALASGCSLSDSAAPASASSSSSVTPAAATPVTACWPRGERAGLVEQDRVDAAHPFEREAVLHQDAGPGGLARSRSRSRAGSPSPSACGQAITSTVTVASTAMFVSPSSIHTTNVTTAEPVAT